MGPVDGMVIVSLYVQKTYTLFFIHDCCCWLVLDSRSVPWYYATTVRGSVFQQE